MSNTITVTIKERTKGKETWFEGTVALRGARPTKLVRTSDNSFQFASTSSLRAAARNFAKRFNTTVEFAETKRPQSAAAAKLKTRTTSKATGKAAGKSVKKTSRASAKATGKTKRKSTRRR